MKSVLAVCAVILSLVLSLAAMPPPALAQERSEAIERTIQSQIEAFLADDFATAFTFASPGIQGLFGSSERFGQMVRQGYPMVWRPSDVQYLELQDRGGLLFQRVMVRDAGGAPHLLEYQMIDVGGMWRINGVQILRPPGVGA